MTKSKDQATFRVGILTLSDSASQGQRQDESGPEIDRLLTEAGGFEVSIKRVIPDEPEEIKACLKDWSDNLGLHLILTTGGTGLHPRDVTPEATRAVIQREVPGIPELMRIEGMKSTPRAALSRGIAGIRGRTLIVNLPGSKRAVREGLEAILPILHHAVKKTLGDSSPCGG